MNTIQYDWQSECLVAYVSPGKEYLVRSITGARKRNGTWRIPAYQASAAAELASEGFTIDSSVHVLSDIPAPDKTIRIDGDTVTVTFPKNDSYSSVARKLNGVRGNDEGYAEKWFFFGASENFKQKILTAFTGFEIKGDLFQSSSTPAAFKSQGIDRDLVLNRLGDLTSPTANGYVPFQHQREATFRVLESSHGRVLGLDYGLGKSYVASMIAGAIQQVHDTDTIILCPASLQENWQRETDKLIDNPIILSDHFSKIPTQHNRPFVLIADEAHRLAGESKRADDFIKLASQSMFTLPLTGAPVRHGDPTTAYNLLRAIRHPIATIEREIFEARYSSHEANLSTFYEETKDDIIRIRKRDCLDLPPRTDIIRPVEVTASAEKYYKDHLEVAKAKYLDAIKRGEKLSRYFLSALVHYVRQSASLAKVPETIALAKEIVEEGNQAVIFVAYRKTGKAIINHFGESIVTVTGDTPQKDRQANVDLFQAGDKKLLLASYGAAGFGLTLTSGNYNLLVDRPFSVEPNDTDNAASRIDRIGQDKPTFIVWLQFNPPTLSSPDKRIDDMIRRKHRGNEMALSGKEDELVFAVADDLFN